MLEHKGMRWGYVFLKSPTHLDKDDVFEVLKLEGSVSARNHVGGTAPSQVKTQIARLKKQL